MTAGNVQPGDTAPSWTESYTTKNVGTGKTLTPASLVVNDGVGGADYNYTYTQVATGVISKTNLTVTATANTKLYDGTTGAAATPTVTAGNVQPGDTAPSWTESYTTKNVGTGKTLTPASLVVNDGVGGADYNYTYTAIATGVISKTNLTVTAVANTKPYDGNTTAAATPTVTAGSIQTGDTASFTEAYTTASVGTGKTLTPAGIVSDANLGANYAYSFMPVSTGVITPPCGVGATSMHITDNLDGTFTLSFVGTAQALYYLAASPDAAAALNTWAPVTGSTNAASDPSGSWQINVNHTGPQMFYRGAVVDPCP